MDRSMDVVVGEAARPGRRGALGQLAALVAGAGLAAVSSAPPAEARRPRARVRLSCNLYSFNEPLRKGTLGLEEALELCADLGFAAVDPTAYYFPGYPAVPEDAYLHRIKRRVYRLGLAISGTGVRNDFTLADGARRAAEVERVKSWIVAAAKLGAPNLRVFSGAAIGPDGPPREEVAARVAECLATCAEHGARHGVMLALQNHADFLRTADDVLDLLRRVGSDWLGVNLDIGSFPTPDPYRDVARVVPHAITWQLKEQVRRNEAAEATDLGRIAGIVKAAGYRGYLPIETLGPGDSTEKVRRFFARVSRAFAGLT